MNRVIAADQIALSTPPFPAGRLSLGAQGLQQAGHKQEEHFHHFSFTSTVIAGKPKYSWTAFEMGETLTKAARAHGGIFDHGAMKLCHPHCAKFCVLGGGSCL
jgi:hypothetical protein